MLQRNDSGVPLHITTPLPVTVGDGETVDYPTAVAGLTPVDHEFVDGDWRPIPVQLDPPDLKAARKAKAEPADTALEV